MIKKLPFVLLSILLMLTSSALAEEVTINFDDDYQTLFPTLPGVSSGTGAEAVTDGDFTEVTTSTAINGVTVTVSVAEEGKTANRIWNASPRLRMYSGTFTVTGTNITKIVFSAPSKFNMTASVGTIEGKTWTGDKTNEVIFTVAGNTQMKNIVVTLGEGGGEVTPPTPEVELITVAKALEIIDGLEDGAKTDKEYQVKGFVVTVDEISTAYGNATFDIADSKGGSPVLKFFRGKGFGEADITNENLLKVDDEVVVQGKLQKYVKNDVTTPEVAQGGKIISINGKTSDGDTPVSDVEKAANIAAFKAVESGKLVELTLTNAQVLYVNNYNDTKELFIRDASGAADLYNLGIDAEAGQVLNGTIIGKRGVRSGFTFALLKADNTNPSTVTVGAKQNVEPAAIASLDEATYDAYGCELVKITSVKVSADGKKAMAGGDELALYDRFQTGLLSGLDEETEYDITGLIYDGGETYGTELVVTALTKAGGGEIIENPATPVANIAALLALESPSANLELTLTNAKVLFNDGNYIYVRENGKAVCFYKVEAVKELFKNNAIINGVIDVDYEVYKLLPEVKANKNTNAEDLAVEESEEAAEPVQTTLAEVATGANVCDLVTLTANLIRETTYKEDGETVSDTKYYLQDGDTKLIVVNNNKNLKKLADDGVETIVVTGIVNTNNNAYQVKLTKNAVDSNAVVKGDANGDGKVDITDVTYIIDKINGNTTADFVEEAADADGSGTVDITDVTLVIDIINKQ